MAFGVRPTVLPPEPKCSARGTFVLCAVSPSAELGRARLSGRVTKFGSFLDSSLDRLSDMVAFLGIIIFYARQVPQHSLLNVFLAGLGMIASVMVSYTTARSEGLGVKAHVGFLQRPERMVLLIIGALSTWDWNSDFFLFNRMPQVLWGLAIGSLWTMVQRMIYIWKEFERIEGDGAGQ